MQLQKWFDVVDVKIKEMNNTYYYIVPFFDSYYNYK